MGVARRVAAATIALLSLWQLIVWGFWGVLVLLFARGFYGNGEVASTPRQVVLGLALLALAVLNPATAFALLLRAAIVTWGMAAAIVVLDLVASAFFFAGSSSTWTAAATPIVSAVLLVIAYPRRAQA